MSDILNSINNANDIKKVNPSDYKRLASEIRHFLLKNISKTGGHLASNLGAVELTMALHLSMDFPKDKLVWDVGHQAYTHKLLTGRKKEFETLRCFEGMSGFPKTKESDSDAFNTGHSSTSISAALGIANARDLNGQKFKVAAVIGDGALSGGMAYEALNNAARLKSNLIIVLNDNNMSISENVGGMANYLGKLRTDIKYHNLKNSVESTINKVPVLGTGIMEKLRKSKDSVKRLFIPGMLFEDMGLTYIGPIDGHDINQLLTAFNSASRVNEAVLIHVITKKGKGYQPAEMNPSKYHGVDTFDLATGECIAAKTGNTYTEVFSETMVELAGKYNNLVAISAAMPSGTGLNKFRDLYPKRFFDVGIAEEHAVTFAAGLASGGMKPVVAIYSTFLQRAYDQIIHDVCISGLPVIFAIDRAGLVGNDGETHQGIFDISFLSHIPGLTVLAPKNAKELSAMLDYAVEYNGPISIRYPRGKAFEGMDEFQAPIVYGKSEVLYEAPADSPQPIVLLAVGSMVETAALVRELLLENNIDAGLINVRFISPMDEELLHELATEYNVWITLEENIKAGGYGEKISGFLLEQDYKQVKHINISLPGRFIEHGDVPVLKENLLIDGESIYRKVLELL
ncbi:MAG: deoxyxylulose-5-phosphate synthase [Lachnospiraceae bacterium]|nr:deoxyxylulose-5-phosphate synthase [Lachnospiraceae bacterium]